MVGHMTEEKQLNLLDRPRQVATVPFVRGSETSEAAAEAKRPTAASDEGLVLDFITSRGSTGATDDELEVALGMLHQNASARRCSLVGKGLVRNSGARRPTRSGKRATVWMLGKGDALIGASNDRVKRPGKDDLRVAANVLEAHGGSVDTVTWLRWMARH